MKFYTSISRYGNQLLFRGYDNGKKIQQKIKYDINRFRFKILLKT